MTTRAKRDEGPRAPPLVPGTLFLSDIPERLDRLPWSRWHWRVIAALGVTWMLDGLEVTLVGAVAPLLASAGTLHLSDAQVGAAGSTYLAGAVSGALIFGRLSDRFGRRRLFLITLVLYSTATAATALSWSFASFAFFRALTGAGIGGECSAVNSAIDELIPARVRGQTDLAINATYWFGTVLGALVTIILANAYALTPGLAWRAAFLLGAVLGLAILLLRNHLPESPRWLLQHGRVADAEVVTAAIERAVCVGRSRALPAPGPPQPLQVKGSVGFSAIIAELIRIHPRRTVLGLSLMVAQAFAYNGVFFTYPLVLVRFYGVPPRDVGLYLIPFAIGNLLGPIALGKLFDSVGRRSMIAGTYMTTALLLTFAGWGLLRTGLSPAGQTFLWCMAFFVASAAASSAYLTVSELFPVELRGMAIAIFYSVGTACGGLIAPALFGVLLQTGERANVFVAYLVGAALMALGGIVAAALGVPAERKSLEQIARLSR